MDGGCYMSELSYLWDGIVTGDATEAPYRKDGFNTYITGIHSADTDDVLVIPGYLNDLDILLTGGLGVSVSTGAALLQNYVYVNDSAVSFSLTPPALYNFRYDYVALQLDTTNQQIRLVIIEGVDTDDYTTLETPNLTQTAALWQSPIAKIFIDSRYSLDAYHIYDERMFAVTSYSQNTYRQNNLIYNSEMMYIDGSGVPERWQTGGAFTTLQADTKLSPMTRGQSVRFDGNALYHYITTNSRIYPGHIYTLQGVIKEITGDDSYIRIYLQGLLVGGINVVDLTSSVEYIKLEADDEIIFTLRTRIDIDTPLYGFRLFAYSDGGDTSLGQCILTEGYHPGPFRQFEEQIILQEAVTDAAWSDTAKSTGTTTIDFTSDFNALIQPKTKAVILRLRGRDSGSAAGAPYMRILGYAAPFASEYGRLDLEGVTNDVYREIVCLAPVNQPLYDIESATPSVRIDVAASGAGTFDATVEVLGIVI